MTGSSNDRNYEDEEDLIQFSSDTSSDEEGVFEKYSAIPIKRMAIIDTCNILHQAGAVLKGFENCAQLNPDERSPDAVGILLVTKYLLEEGYDIRMFVPVSYMNKNKVANLYILELHLLGYLTVIDDGSHDDLVILEMAKNVGGFVISNDKFRDHAQVEGLTNLIQQRTVLCLFERIPIETRKECLRKVRGIYSTGLILTLKPNSKAMYAENDDPSFAMAFAQRMLRSEMESRNARAVLDVLCDYYQQKNCAAQGLAPPNLDYFDPTEENLPEEFTVFLDLFCIAQEKSIV